MGDQRDARAVEKNSDRTLHAAQVKSGNGKRLGLCEYRVEAVRHPKEETKKWLEGPTETQVLERRA